MNSCEIARIPTKWSNWIVEKNLFPVIVGGFICKTRLTRKTTATVVKSSRHYFPLIGSKRLWSKNGYSTKSQPTSRHGYRSECATKGVLQSSCEIVGQPKLDPKIDDLAAIVRGGLAADCWWRHYWRRGLCRASVAEENQRGNSSPHSIPLSASANILHK